MAAWGRVVAAGLVVAALMAGPVLPARAAAAELYVALTGDDQAGNGSESRPFASLARAAEAARPGATVYVRGGVYELRQRQILAVRGGRDASIVFRPYPSETVVLDGTRAPLDRWEALILIEASSYVVFEGFEVRNSAGAGIDARDSSFVTVRRCFVHHVQDQAITGEGEGITVEENEVAHAALRNQNGVMRRGGWPGAISSGRRSNGLVSTNMVVRRNHVHDSWGEGIVVGVDGGLVQGNVVHDTWSVNIYVDGARDVRVEGNYLYATARAYFREGEPAAGVGLASEGSDKHQTVRLENIVIANNLIAGAGVGIRYWFDHRNPEQSNSFWNVKIHHNVIFQPLVYALSFDAVDGARQPPGGGDVRNNILYAGTAGGAARVGSPQAWTFAYNDWPDGVPASASGPGSFAADPLFVSPLVGGPPNGFKLRPESPVIGRGAPLPEDGPGAAWDFWGRPWHTQRPSPGIHEGWVPGRPQADRRER